MSSGQKKILKKLKKAYKNNNKYYAILADYLFKNGYDQQAQDILEENNDKFPDYTSGYLVLGEIFFSRKEYLKAEDMFKKVIEINKKSVKALKYLASIESLRKDKKAQYDYLTDALRYDSFDQDAKNFILMYSGMYSDEKVVGSSYFSERMSQLLDKDIVNQAVEGGDNYKSTFDMEELSRIALEEKEKMDMENGIVKLEESAEEIRLDQNLGNEETSFNTETELNIEKNFKQTIVIERDGSDDLDLLTQSEGELENKELEEFEKELEEFKSSSHIEIPVPQDISEIFDTSDESDNESQNFDSIEKRVPLKELYASTNNNLKAMEKYGKLLEKIPDNKDFKAEFLFARSSFIKHRLTNEIRYYTEMSEKYPDNTKYSSKLKSFQDINDTVDDYNLK